MARAGTEYERTGLYEKAAFLYRDVARFHLHHGNHAQALEVLEAGRARTFHAQLFSTLPARLGSARSATLQTWTRAQSRVAALRRATVRGSATQELTAALQDAELEFERADARLKSDLGAAAADASPATGAELIARAAQALAPGPSALVVYFFSNSESYALVITREGLRGSRRLQSSALAIRTAIGRLWGKLSTERSGWQEDAHALHAALLRPILPLLPAPAPGTRRRIGFVPYGDLGNVPFQLLMEGSRPLLADADVFYLPSLRSYPALVESSSKLSSGEVYAFGYDGKTLKYAESEATSVATSPEHAFVGPKATTVSFEAKVASVPILHLSMHALTSRSDPFQSELVFADRSLRLDEVLGMQVGAKLLTLNACDTDAGYISPTGDRSSLAWAFLANGLPSVVTSEWRVMDRPEMIALFKTFYQRLLKGVDAVEALGTAERDLLSEGVPAWQWGAFQLVGSDR